jgi:mRNA interferase RelE/StbE
MLRKYFIYFDKDAEKSLLKIPSNISLKIKVVINGLMTNPYLGIKLHGKLSHLRKIKVSNYRVIYYIIEDKIMIEIKEVESRGNVSYDK